MRTVVEVLAALYDSRQAATELAQARDDPFIRGLATGIEAGLDLAIEALADLPLMAGRCS